MRKLIIHFILITLIIFFTVSCGPKSSNGGIVTDSAAAQFTIVSGSENKTLEPLIERWAKEKGVNVKIDYSGSVDIMMLLEDGDISYDAVWPANSIWIDLGDTKKQVKDSQSIMWSPVVFALKRSVVERLGWIGKTDIKVDDILKVAESGQIRYMMTSATQSNSGASAYLGFLYAFAGKPTVLTSEELNKPVVMDKVKRLMSTVDRSSGSSGWLKDLFLTKYDAYDGMVNYEAVIIEVNNELAKMGKEQLYVIYPSDGLAIADSPLGFVDQQDSKKHELFLDLQKYLLTPEAQKEILAMGRRTGPIGDSIQGADPMVFKSDWGIRMDQFMNQIRYPKAEVLREALDLYQSAYRKPSLTVFCLDFSGSMKGKGEEGVKTAMRTLLDQKMARRYMLQASKNDITIVILFSDKLMETWRVEGNDNNKLNELWAKINATMPDGGTDIFTPTMSAYEIIAKENVGDKYLPAVILMTDGESNRGATFAAFQTYKQQLNAEIEIPVFALLFGEANETQLKQITTETMGRIFDGNKDLSKAFREAKGYN